MPPVPWTAINQYAFFYDFDGEQTSRLHYFVGKMDKAMKEWSDRKNGNKQKSNRVRHQNQGGRKWGPR